MPIYEFECNECHNTFEKLCSMKEDLSVIACEYCKAKNVKKKMSSFASGNKRNTLDTNGGCHEEHSHSHGGCSCGCSGTHNCGCC